MADFQTISGLAISPAKSCFFPSGLSTADISAIETASGIPRGHLPIQYLGLPLSTKKLSLVDCEPLLQRIESKIGSWTAKYLFFAGRLQLLDTVISGITNFWIGAFILPKKCIELINSMSSSYLWKGSIEGKHTARIAWDTVTTPKEEGGLGIKNLLIWNRTYSLKLLWMLIFKSDSVWTAWIQQNVIKDQDFWTMKPAQSHTWMFKHLLKQRQTALQWYQISPGNGTSCRFWIDPWTPYGPLIKFIGGRGPQQTGISITTKVSSVWFNESWNLPSARSDRFEQLLMYLTTVTLDDTEEFPRWRIHDEDKDYFCFRFIYNHLREIRPTVPWHKIIWIKRGIPKHKTLTWMVIQNRCPTRDRLISWGLQVDPQCLL